MKIQRNKLFRLAATGTAGLALAQAASAATVLDSITGFANDEGVPSAYGSNLAGTPDIALNWGGGTKADGWDSYGTWDGRDQPLQTDYTQLNPMSVSFTPGSATIGVLITSFELDEWAGGGDSVINWTVKNGGTTIVSGTFDDFNNVNDPGDAGGRSLVNTGMTTAQALANAGDVLTLEFTMASGDGAYQAMDNLTFDQVAVPEPSSAALAALGLGAMAMRRKRK